MDVIGDEIERIFHTGGVQHEDAIVDTYAILLKSGRCIELTGRGIIATEHMSMLPDPAFDCFIGLAIVGVEKSEYWPTCGIRLNGGSALVMGSPAPYYWGLYEETATLGRDGM